jgi:hypothetical protein
MAGAAIWYITGPRKAIHLVFFILAIVLSTLSPTDLNPRMLRDTNVIPFVLKALPYVLIWVAICYEMMTFNATHAKNARIPQIAI